MRSEQSASAGADEANGNGSRATSRVPARGRRARPFRRAGVAWPQIDTANAIYKQDFTDTIAPVDASEMVMHGSH